MGLFKNKEQIDIDIEDAIVVHLFHHFPDELTVDLKVTIDQVPTSLGLIPSTPTRKE